MLLQRVATTTHSQLWAMTSRGRVLPTTVEAVAEVTGRSRGTAVSELFALDKGEVIRTLVTGAPAGGDEPPPLLLVTAQGLMKRLTVEELTGTAGRQAGDQAEAGRHGRRRVPRAGRHRRGRRRIERAGHAM